MALGAEPGRPLSPFLKLSLALHGAALAGGLVLPRAWLAFAAAVFADHLVLAGAGMWPRSRLLGPNLRALPAAAAAGGEVALTFDDGPHPEATPRLLEILQRHHAAATFFWVGRRVERHPELVDRALAHGHEVQSHSHRHSNAFCLLPPAALGREIDRAQRALVEAGAPRPTLFRAPAGVRSPWLDPLLARRGLRLVSWTRRGFDAVDRRPERVAERLLAGLSGGDVLLLHDAPPVGAGDREPASVEVLPRLLAAIAATGLRTVTLADCLQRHGGGRDRTEAGR